MEKKTNDVYYVDQKTNGIINGHYCGVRVGVATKDAADPTADSDGFNGYRITPHKGLLLKDPIDPKFPTKKTD